MRPRLWGQAGVSLVNLTWVTTAWARWQEHITGDAGDQESQELSGLMFTPGRCGRAPWMTIRVR